MHPIYFVISQQMPTADEVGMRYGLPNIILDVIECDAADIDSIYQDRVVPLQNGRGYGIRVTYFTREPRSAFQSWSRRESTPAARDYTDPETWQ